MLCGHMANTCSCEICVWVKVDWPLLHIGVALVAWVCYVGSLFQHLLALIQRWIELVLSILSFQIAYTAACTCHHYVCWLTVLITLLMNLLVLSRDLKVPSLLKLFLFITLAYNLSLLPLDQLHEIGSLLLCYLFAIYFLESIPSQDNDLVSVFRNQVHWVITEVKLLERGHCLQHGAYLLLKVLDPVSL